MNPVTEQRFTQQLDDIANRLRESSYDQYLPPPMRGAAKDFFVYTAEFLPLAAGGTAAQNVAIQSDSAFLLTALTRVVTAVDNTTVVTFAPMMLQLTDLGSGRALMDRPVHLESLAGTAQLQSTIFPKFINPASTLGVQLQNLDLVTARNVRLAFLGFKVFGSVRS